MTADEEVENNAPNCNKPKLNDDPFADMRDGGAASMVAHTTDEPTAEDKLEKCFTSQSTLFDANKQKESAAVLA
jgi:hypothetical protein